MSKKCKITINMNGVPHIIEDSILDSGSLDEALSEIYKNQEIYEKVVDNELRRSKNAFSGFNESMSDQEIVELGVQGNHSFKSLINEYHQDGDLSDWIQLFEDSGINISDNNILLKERINDSDKLEISSPSRTFYVIDESFLRTPDFIRNKLVSLFIDNKIDSSLYKHILEEVKKDKLISKLIIDTDPKQFMKNVYSNAQLKNILQQSDLFDNINEIIVSELYNNIDALNLSIASLSKKIESNNITYDSDSNRAEAMKNNMRRTFTGNVTSLKNNEIFVFGSNTQGRHGYGSAKDALGFGQAIYGQAMGLQGKSYAIVTKDLTKPKNEQLRSISPAYIEEQIAFLYKFARENPDKDFLVAYKKEGTNNNGYTNKEMASMFAKHEIPINIVFEQGFNELVNEINPRLINKLIEPKVHNLSSIDFGNFKITKPTNVKIDKITRSKSKVEYIHTFKVESNKSVANIEEKKIGYKLNISNFPDIEAYISKSYMNEDGSIEEGSNWQVDIKSDDGLFYKYPLTSSTLTDMIDEFKTDIIKRSADPRSLEILRKVGLDFGDNTYSISYKDNVYDFQTNSKTMNELLKELYPNESDERINKAIDYLKSGNNEFIENLINKLTNCK